MTATACRRGRPGLLILTVAALGCSSASGADEASDASTSDAQDGGTSCLVCREASFDGPPFLEVKGILDQVCGNVDGCHGGGAGNFGLQPGSEFSAMIGVTSTENPPMKRVVPGDPAHSYVYLKLACDGGIVGACMPLSTGSNPMYAKLFHDWIEAGAVTQ